MKYRKMLLDVIPNFVTNGIFAKIDNLYDVPWDTAASVIDTDYIAGESGEKNISPLVERLLPESGVLDSVGLATLASIIWNRYGDNWRRIWEVLHAEYAPLENYNMTETVLETEGVGRNPDLTSENEIKSETKNRDSGVYGFNSSESVPSTTETETTTGKRINKETGDEKTSRLNNRSTTRSGNIGVTTAQQMAESELALRKKKFWQLVYADCDEVLTLPIYCSEVRYYET